MLYVVMVDVNQEPPDQVAEPPATVLYVPPGLDHAVCQKGKCQRGVAGDYCLSNQCVFALLVGNT